MGKASKPAAFTEELRQAVRKSPLGPRALSRLSGVDASIISRFARGLTWITAKHLDALALALGLHVTVYNHTSRTGRGAKRPSGGKRTPEREGS